MQTLRITMNENVPLGELAHALSCVSELYRILSLAYSEQNLLMVDTQQNEALKDVSGHYPWDAVEDLQVVAFSSGSIIIDLAKAFGAGKALEVLLDWLRSLIDPHRRKKTELEIREKELEIRKGEIEFAITGVELVDKALDMHDHMLRSNFPEPFAKQAFVSALGCIRDMRVFQDRNNAIVTVEMIEM